MAAQQNRWRTVYYRILVVALVGAIVLAGWVLQVDLMTRLLPHSTPVNPLAAITLELAALALWLQRDGPAPGWRARVARTASLLVIAVGMTRMFDALVGTAVCPDYLLFASQLGPDGRITPLGAFAFTLLGLGLLLIDAGRPKSVVWHPQWIPSLVVPIVTYSFADYLFEGAHMSDPGGMRPLGVATAYCMLLLALSTWFSRSDQGPMSLVSADNPGSRMIRYMLPVAAYLPVMLTGFAVVGIHRNWFSTERGAAMTVFWAVIAIAAITIAISSRLQVLDTMRRKTLQELKARVAQDEASVRLSEALIRTEEVLRSATGSPRESAARLLSFLAEFLGVPQLCLYIVEESAAGEPELTVMASYANGGSAQLDQRIPMGEGLAGQCASTRRTISMEQIPQEYFRIRSGTLDLLPRQLLFLPLTVDEEPVGVLELAWLKPLQEDQRRFLESAARTVAFALFRLREQMRMQRLLDALASARGAAVAG